MNATEQLAEIRERIAQLSLSEHRELLIAAKVFRETFEDFGDIARLALALVSAEMAVEVKP